MKRLSLIVLLILALSTVASASITVNSMTSKAGPHGMTEWTITGTCSASSPTGSATLPKSMAGMIVGGYFKPGVLTMTVGTTVKVFHPVCTDFDLLGGDGITTHLTNTLPLSPYIKAQYGLYLPTLGYSVVTIGVNAVASATWTLILYTY